MIRYEAGVPAHARISSTKLRLMVRDSIVQLGRIEQLGIEKAVTFDLRVVWRNICCEGRERPAIKVGPIRRSHGGKVLRREINLSPSQHLRVEPERVTHPG